MNEECRQRRRLGPQNTIITRESKKLRRFVGTLGSAKWGAFTRSASFALLLTSHFLLVRRSTSATQTCQRCSQGQNPLLRQTVDSPIRTHCSSASLPSFTNVPVKATLPLCSAAIFSCESPPSLLSCRCYLSLPCRVRLASCKLSPSNCGVMARRLAHAEFSTSTGRLRSLAACRCNTLLLGERRRRRSRSREPRPPSRETTLVTAVRG